MSMITHSCKISRLHKCDILREPLNDIEATLDG